MNAVEKHIDAVVQGFITCAIWADLGDHPHARITQSAKDSARDICTRFATECGPLFEQAINMPGYTAGRFGHDFYLSANGHGVGFDDRDELMNEPPCSEAINMTTKDRDGKPYPVVVMGDELGDSLQRVAHGGKNGRIGQFEFISIYAYRGWIYFD